MSLNLLDSSLIYFSSIVLRLTAYLLKDRGSGGGGGGGGVGGTPLYKLRRYVQPEWVRFLAVFI